MTSVISPPRRLLALCSPRTQRTASTTLDLPEPLGPTTAVMPGGKSKAVLSANDLNPTSSRRLSIDSPAAQPTIHRPGCCTSSATGKEKASLGLSPCGYFRWLASPLFPHSPFSPLPLRERGVWTLLTAPHGRARRLRPPAEAALVQRRRRAEVGPGVQDGAVLRQQL